MDMISPYNIVVSSSRLEMRTKSYLETILKSLENLSLEDQNYLFDLIKQRRIEKRRGEIAKNAEETLKALEMGTAKRGNVEDLRADLLLIVNC